jgi:capsular polysaccharide biosynthesis protein
MNWDKTNHKKMLLIIIIKFKIVIFVFVFNSFLSFFLSFFFVCDIYEFVCSSFLVRSGDVFDYNDDNDDDDVSLHVCLLLLSFFSSLYGTEYED